MKQHLGTITILVKDRHTNAKNLNQVLTEHGNLIIARLGLNIDRRCIKNCTGMITIAVEGTAQEINNLTKELNNLYGIVAKRCIITE